MADRQKPNSAVLLQGGTVVNADSMFKADVLVLGEKIVQIEPDIVPDDLTLVLEIPGRYVIPGGVDPHTHFDFEFMGTKTADDFYTGTVAAVKGGTTTIIDFVAPRKGETLSSAYDRYVKKAEGKVVCDYRFHMIITSWNDKIAKEMEIIAKEKGINSFKMFMAYKDIFMVNDSELYQAFTKCKRIGALPMVHGENGLLVDVIAKELLSNGITGPEGHTLSRPEAIEEEATNRACVIANQVNSPLYVVHVMCDEAVQAIVNHRHSSKLPIFAETLAAALGSSGAPDGCEFHVGAGHVMSPPIRRNPQSKVKLMNRLATGDLSCTGSDHCSFTSKLKERGKGCFTQIPSGVTGVEDRMCIVWQNGVNQNILTETDFVAVTSTNAAKIFNIYPQKGVIAVDSDADIVVWNPHKRKIISSKTHMQANDFNIFEGMEIVGCPEYTLVRGKICLENDQMHTVKGFGKYLPAACFNQYVYNI